MEIYLNYIYEHTYLYIHAYNSLENISERV